MSYFPLCINLTEATVLLVGNGPQIQEKQEKLLPGVFRMFLMRPFPYIGLYHF